MAESEFKLPYSSFSELKKLLIAFAKSKSPSSLADINKLTSMPTTSISTNNGFLESIGIISGGKKKEATENGKKIGLAFANNMDEEASRLLNSLLKENEFLESMITALGIKPRSNDDFQSHIAYSLNKSNKRGAGTIIEMMIFANIIEEKDGLLNPLSKPQVEKTNELNNEEKQDYPSVQLTNIKQQSITKQLTNDLGQNITLNINIQLTMPESENEKVYENFFQALKKHLLS